MPASGRAWPARIAPWPPPQGRRRSRPGPAARRLGWAGSCGRRPSPRVAAGGAEKALPDGLGAATEQVAAVESAVEALAAEGQRKALVAAAALVKADRVVDTRATGLDGVVEPAHKVLLSERDQPA